MFATRIVLSLSAAVAVAVCPALALDQTSARAATSPAYGASPAEQSAAARAEATNEPVVVTSETTPTAQVTAEPDGTFSLQVSHEPVRALRGDQWVPLDTTLHWNSDGTISPAATDVDLTISGGGTNNFASVSDEGATVDYGWPEALPTPTLSGDTATYTSLLPGVDLRVTAEASGFSDVLVVHDPTAAANPDLRHLTFPVSTQGLTLSASRGGLVASDSSGQPVFTSATPTMWDSNTDSDVGKTPAGSDPETGQTISMPASVDALQDTGDGSTAQEIVSPPVAALTDPSLRYPLFIDPGVTINEQHEMVTMSAGWHYYDDPNNDLKVGKCPQGLDPTCNGIGTGHAFLDFSTQYLIGRATAARIYSAEVDVYEIHNSGRCTPEPVDLWSAGDFSATTTWPGPLDTDLGSANSNRGDSCGNTGTESGYVALPFATATVQSATNASASHVNFGLTSHSESDDLQWKRFAQSGASSTPELVVTYSFPPSAPTNLSVSDSVACSGKPVYTRDTTPVLHARAQDNNPSPGPLQLHYEVADDPVTRDYAVSSPSGVPTTTNVDAPFALDGPYSSRSTPLPQGSYLYTVTATNTASDGTATSSGVSGTYHFTVDATAPSVPKVSSATYPKENWGAAQQQPGFFSVSSTGSPAGFAYAFDSAGTELKPSDTTCNYNDTAHGWVIAATSGGTHIVPPTSLPVGRHTLFVKAFDGAHNFSGESVGYSFYIGPTIAVNQPANLQEAEASYNANVVTGSEQYDRVYSDTFDGASSGHAIALQPDGRDEGSVQSPRRFTFTFNVPVTADYALGVGMMTGNRLGESEFEIDGTPVVDGSTGASNGSPLKFDAYDSSLDWSVWNSVYVPFGGYHLTAGTAHTFTVDLVGADPTYTDPGNGNTESYSQYLYDGFASSVDYLMTVPLTLTTGAQLGAQLDNDGITDGSAAGNVGPSADAQSLSQQAMTTLGLTTGSAYTVPDGTNARFTLPTPNGALDNMIATGQTVDLVHPKASNRVDLLVMSTCGTINPNGSAALQLGVIQTDADGNTYSSSVPFPTIPDWRAAVPTNLAASVTALPSMSQRYVGTNATSGAVQLYHVKLPTQLVSGRIVSSVVFPSFGSSLTNSCTTATLHVLAVSLGNSS